MSQPMAQPAAQARPPVVTPQARPGYPQQQRERRWYTEPVAIATVIVLILVVIALVILLNQAGW
jgi:hypothetical protein